jgi:hypothetical protein
MKLAKSERLFVEVFSFVARIMHTGKVNCRWESYAMAPETPVLRDTHSVWTMRLSRYRLVVRMTSH